MTIHQQVVRELAVRILSGEVNPGDVLSTEDIASAELDVSRTAYREAIKVLTAKGLLESRPKVGTRVLQKTFWNMLDPDIIGWKSEIGDRAGFIDDLFEFRQIIEPAAARLAARKATPQDIEQIQAAFTRMSETDAESPENFEADFEFHNAILQASNNELLCSLGHVVEALLLTSFELSALRPGAREDSLPLHETVLTHIRLGAENAARDAMATLLTSARDDLDEVFKPDAEATTEIRHAVPEARSTRNGKYHSRN
ncbi:FadR/GntR family transcriptional regulator [Alisedimentitalea sp. MJ-SS2]|uniref:FadR/GntR family transcriptional regulator n=1 Tax=Aliisedimentitalea sp. MJ-SS2 TaxID=3049795 RepID=UPI0029098D1D|nr:FadR/GntR family transcriptional regulator [Alisedimentitalea sp. MJ-SS2]MDU8927040.1 FadR/GntR family transcriptional regulator [Alisedimentitalea sp. MJ-SS2]